MAIELIGMQGGHPEFRYSSFINPAVMAVVNNPGLERIVLQGLQISEKGQIPIDDVRQLVQMSSKVRKASRSEQGGFREIVVYLGKKQNDSTKVGALPYVGVESNVPIPFAGQTEAILSDLSSDSDILIVHSHPSSADASDADLQALLKIYRALSMKSDRNTRASLLIIGADEEILHTFDSRGRYMSINLGKLIIKERLAQPLLDRLSLLKYKGNRFDKDADSFKPIWYGDSKLYPPEIPGTGLLFPGYLASPLPSHIIPNNAILEELPTMLYVTHTNGAREKFPVVYIEKDGAVKPLERSYGGEQYGYILNGIPYFSSPTSLFPNIGTKVAVPQKGIKIADYQVNLTGGRTTHKVEIVAIPRDLLPK